MNSRYEMILGIIGLVVIPPTVGSFVFFKEETAIYVKSCDTHQGRRGSSLNVYTDDGERLEVAPPFLGGPDMETARRRLCPSQRANVSIRGVKIEALPFWHRMIFKVE